eukprot:scaffold7026_cov65-Phaeocystis_antarctica.AAC.5
MQGYHPHITRRSICSRKSHGCQQITVKVAEITAEELSLDWRVNEFALLVILFVVSLLDEVQAVLHEAQRYGPLPLARDRAAVLASEREDLQPVVALVAHKQLLAYHRHPTSTIEQRQPKLVARLQRQGVERDDLVMRIVIVIDEHAEEHPAGREDRADDDLLMIFGACNLCSGVSEAADLVVRLSHIKELLTGDEKAMGGRQIETGAAAHVASISVHCGVRPHYQLVAARFHRHFQRDFAEQILRKVERHLSQAAPALARCLPAVRPLRAHRARRATLQLQRRQQVWHQVTREQHSLNRPLRQRLVRCENGVGPVLDIG